jgi:hypothetical protein
MLTKYSEANVSYVEFSVGWGDMVEKPRVAQEVPTVAALVFLMI